MHMHVNETRHDVAIRRVDDRRTCRVNTGALLDAHDPPVVNQERSVRKHLAWQDQVAAGENDHCCPLSSSPDQFTCT